MNRRLIIAGLCAVALAATGCESSNTTATPAPESTASEPPATDDPVSSTPSVTNEFPPPPTTTTTISCLDADSPVVQEAVDALAPPNGRDHWQIQEIGAHCGALQWVKVETPGGTASSGYQVLFFHDDAFVSTANTFATAYTRVVGESDNSVALQYMWLEGQDASCCPTGGPVTITYTWEGSAVGQDQPLPEAMVESYSH